MLKNIPQILSPELLKVLCEMGHGDRIVLCDGNFPAERIGRENKVLRCDGHGIPELLAAMLTLLPLDTFVEQPVTRMEVVPGDNTETPVWGEYENILAAIDQRGSQMIRNVERFQFYEEAKTAYAVVATGEQALYANIILQKGVIQYTGGSSFEINKYGTERTDV